MSDRLEAAVAQLVGVLREELRTDEVGATDEDQMLKPEDAGLLLSLSAAQVRQLAAAGQIPCIEMPSSGRGHRRCWRFRRGSLCEWIAQREGRQS